MMVTASLNVVATHNNKAILVKGHKKKTQSVTTIDSETVRNEPIYRIYDMNNGKWNNNATARPLILLPHEV